MLAEDLKKYIIDNDKTLELITLLGCTKIKPYPDKFQCARPNGDNPTGMIIWKDSLIVKIYTPHKGSGNIFTLTMATYGIEFPDALKKIHELLDIPYTKYKKPKKEEEKVDILESFKKIKRKKKYNNDFEEVLFDYDEIGNFFNIPHIMWVRDGILPSVMKEFNIGYDFKRNRITIPWRGLDPSESRYVGCTGRTVNPNYELLDIPKYYAYNNFLKSNYLYGYAENYEHIIEKGYVLITEAEKSVLKAASRKIRTFLAVGCHSISERQRKILVGLDVEIVISWDSDIELYEVLKTCELFYGIKKVSFTYDRFKILEEKQSVGDLPYKDMLFMIEMREEYTREWHNKYLKMKKEREERD